MTSRTISQCQIENEPSETPTDVSTGAAAQDVDVQVIDLLPAVGPLLITTRKPFSQALVLREAPAQDPAFYRTAPSCSGPLERGNPRAFSGPSGSEPGPPVDVVEQASRSSSSYNFLLGISPFAIRQNRHPLIAAAPSSTHPLPDPRPRAHAPCAVPFPRCRRFRRACAVRPDVLGPQP